MTVAPSVEFSQKLVAGKLPTADFYRSVTINFKKNPVDGAAAPPGRQTFEHYHQENHYYQENRINELVARNTRSSNIENPMVGTALKVQIRLSYRVSVKTIHYVE